MPVESFGIGKLIFSWLKWRFYEAPAALFLIWKNYIYFVSDFFSMPLLLKTFISPWKRYKWSYPKGFNIGGFFSAFISNVFSRIIGIIGRSVLIILGIVSQFFTLVIGTAVISIWIFMPLILIGLFLILLT